MSRGEPIRLFLVDDSALVREGLTIVLDGLPDMEVVGSAGSIEEGILGIEVTKPDVVVVDLRLGSGHGDGLLLCRTIAERRIPAEVVILSAFLSEGLVQAAFRAGARGYVVKDVEPEELASAIRSAAEGKTTIDPKISSVFAMWATRLAPKLGVELRPSEIKVLQHLCNGASTREIAAKTGLSQTTVRSYLRDCLQKLGVKSRAEAVSLALRAGLEPAEAEPLP